MDVDVVKKMNTTSLAYLGDAIYEVQIRTRVIEKLPHDAGRAHRLTVKYVQAESQALIARTMMAGGFLTEEEESLLKRARNHRTMSKPNHANAKDYKLATGLEAVFGYLYLMDGFERIRELTAEAIRIVDEN